MPYQQVFELQDTRLVHGSQIVDQSVNLGLKGIPGSLTSELFHKSLLVQGSNLEIIGTAEINRLTLTGGASVLNLEGGPSLDHAYIAFYPNSQALTTRWAWMGFGTAGSSQFRIKNEQSAGEIKLETTNGILTLDVGTSYVQIVGSAGSSNSVLLFDEGYTIYADNVGSGSAGSRLWFHGDDGGQMVLGPRSGSQFLDNLGFRADEFQFDWSDAAGDEGTVIFPRGFIYDWATDSSSGETLTAWPDQMATMAITLSTPANISITVFVWAFLRVNNSLNQAFVALSALIGGSRLVNPALMELDLATDADATASSSTSHQHPLGIYHGTSHTGNTSSASASHSHSHSHAMSAQWNTLNYIATRSYTPTGTSISVVAEGGPESGSMAFDDGYLIGMVVIN